MTSCVAFSMQAVFCRTLLSWKTWIEKEALPFIFWTADKHPPSCLYCKSHYAPQRPPTNLPSTNTSYCDTLIITSCIQPIPSHEYVMPQNESYSHSRRPAVNKYSLSITHCPEKKYWKPTEAGRRAGPSQQEEWKLLYFIFKKVKFKSHHTVPIIPSMPNKTRAPENWQTHRQNQSG